MWIQVGIAARLVDIVIKNPRTLLVADAARPSRRDEESDLKVESGGVYGESLK